MIVSPLAVHISDGVLFWPWLLAGFILSAGLLAWSARRIPEEEIPRIGLLTAAFFVASLIHIRVGPTSVHLLLNGLVGVILGRRAVLAVAVGLFLQAVLLQHGGFSALGINCCIMAIPALLARPAFHWLAAEKNRSSFSYRNSFMAAACILHPVLMLLPAGIAAIGSRSKLFRQSDANFHAGFIVGLSSVLLTVSLNAAVLVVAGEEDWRVIAALVVVAHIPIALVEGIIVGFAASFLQRVKPEMLG